MTLPMPSLEPSRDKKLLRRQLQAERMALHDRHQRAMHLQEVLRVWLMGRADTAVGAYWPIKGEFDALPALFRWSEAHEGRRIGLPVTDKLSKQLGFHLWTPGCEMEEDAYGIRGTRHESAGAWWRGRSRANRSAGAGLSHLRPRSSGTAPAAHRTRP